MIGSAFRATWVGARGDPATSAAARACGSPLYDQAGRNGVRDAVAGGLRAVKCWVNTISRDHAQAGVAGGFTQAGHTTLCE
jgi:hypothetical protein